MFCPRCTDYFDRKDMTLCEECERYYCEPCWEEHYTSGESHWSKLLPEIEKRKPRISRAKRKQKKNSKLKTDLCDDCHREFLTTDLIYGQEPFAHEIYGSGQYCHLCEDCYNEAILDI